MKDYTVVVTSCGRFDLLKQTLESLRPHLTGPLDSILIIEDSGDTSVREVVSAVLPEAVVLVNDRQMGQLASIDRAYAQVRTPLIFHCEDDWLFTGGGFLEGSAALLEAFPHMSLVSLRSRQEINKRVQNAPRLALEGIEYFEANPALHPEYFGYSFNPGLRRMSDYRRIGPFRSFRGERDISYCFKRLGFTMAYLERACVTHIGDQRHVDDPQTHLRARTFSQRLRLSCRLRIDRMHRSLFPSSDPAVQIRRGTGKLGRTRLTRTES